jgi:IS30 family transposase
MSCKRGALKKELTASLRRNHKHRYKQSRGVKNERKIEDMLSIEERPKEVADRIIPSHSEGDLIIGKNNRSALGTLVERRPARLSLSRLKTEKRKR